MSLHDNWVLQLIDAMTDMQNRVETMARFQCSEPTAEMLMLNYVETNRAATWAEKRGEPIDIGLGVPKNSL